MCKTFLNLRWKSKSEQEKDHLEALKLISSLRTTTIIQEAFKFPAKLHFSNLFSYGFLYDDLIANDTGWF